MADLMAELILLGAVGCLTGIVSVVFIDRYALAVYLGWLAIEVVLLTALRRTDVKWILAFTASTVILAVNFSVWYSCTLEYADGNVYFAIIAIAMEYYAPLFILNSIVGWISKKHEEEKSLIRYKNNKSLLRAVEMGIEEKQKLLNQQSRAIEIIALLNACGSSTVSIQRNQNYKCAEDVKTQLAELEAERAKIEFSIEAYEENRAK
mgnify:CR=1 FL=1